MKYLEHEITKMPLPGARNYENGPLHLKVLFALSPLPTSHHSSSHQPKCYLPPTMTMNTLVSLQIRPLAPTPFQNSCAAFLPASRFVRLPLQSPAISPLLSSRSDGGKSPSNESDGIPAGHVKTLAKFKSRHNYIRVLQVSRRADHPMAGSRLLLLDAPGNIHSISFLLKLLTGTYFDVFATLPPVLPPGPIAVLGFGAGSAARLILSLYPSAEIHGWELDPSVLAVGREYFGLAKLEKEHAGRLFLYVGDALEAEIGGGFAGVLVDLFAKGSVLPELQDYKTWEKMRKRLRRGGRVMVNCGGRCVEAEDPRRDGGAVMAETLAAMRRAFADKVFVLKLGRGEEDSTVALTGPLPDPESWKRALQPALSRYVGLWAPYGGQE